MRLPTFFRDRRVLFLVVGGLNTALSLALFVLAYQLAGHVIGYVGALIVSYAMAMVISFGLQRTIVFQSSGNPLLEFRRYATVQLGSLGVNAVLLPLAVELLRLPVYPAQVLSLLITIVVTYLLHLRFTFVQRPN